MNRIDKTPSHLTIKTFVVGYIETNMYLIHDNKTGIIIDPGFIESEAAFLIEKIRKEVAEIPTVILTHCHFDHISGCAIMKKGFGCRIYCHRLDEEKLLDSQKSGATFFGVFAEPLKPDGYLEDEQEVKFGGAKLKIIHTPGHTGGGISILLDEKYLFSGDTIFKSSIGRTDLYDGDYDTEINSIKKRILVLPDDVIIYPGHGPATTIGDERKKFY